MATLTYYHSGNCFRICKRDTIDNDLQQFHFVYVEYDEIHNSTMLKFGNNHQVNSRIYISKLQQKKDPASIEVAFTSKKLVELLGINRDKEFNGKDYFVLSKIEDYSFEVIDNYSNKSPKVNCNFEKESEDEIDKDNIDENARSAIRSLAITLKKAGCLSGKEVQKVLMNLS